MWTASKALEKVDAVLDATMKADLNFPPEADIIGANAKQLARCEALCMDHPGTCELSFHHGCRVGTGIVDVDSEMFPSFVLPAPCDATVDNPCPDTNACGKDQRANTATVATLTDLFATRMDIAEATEHPICAKTRCLQTKQMQRVSSKRQIRALTTRLEKISD